MKFYTDVSTHFNTLLYTGYDENGRFRKEVTDFDPEFYELTKRETGWKTLHEQNVLPIRFASVKEAREFMKSKKEIANYPLFGNENFIAQYIQRLFPNEIHFDMEKIVIGNIDIEVKSDEGFPDPMMALHPITAITYKASTNKKYFVFSTLDYDESKAEEPNTQYFKCANEVEILTKFFRLYCDDRFTPDVFTGWNINFFDIPYIINRCHNVMGEGYANKLSPWGLIAPREITQFGRVQQQWSISGVQILDYLDLFKKFGVLQYGTPESFKLDNIANVVLGEKKLDYSEYGSLNTLYKENPQKYIDYNVQDVKLVDRIDEACDYITLAISIAARAGVNFVAALGTTQVWDTLIYRELMKEQVVIPFQKENIKTPYPGGYVKDPRIGKTDWVVSFDLNSLYPNLIIQYNMSPETIVGMHDEDMDVEKALSGKFKVPSDYALAANGVLFRKDKLGIMPRIVKDIYNERKVVKKKMIEKQKLAEKSDKATATQLKKEINILHSQQHSIKILLNSLYGALGNAYYRHFDQRIASAITLSGQLSILWAEKYINMFMNMTLNTKDVDYIIAIDTDSVYLDMSSVVEKLGLEDKKQQIDALDQFCGENVTQAIAVAYEILFKKMNAYENRMEMAREVIADRGIWTGKKHYILNVYDNEGVRYKEPKLKVMGIEAVKSSTPKPVRDKMMDTFKVILTGTESDVHLHIKEFEKEFSALPPEEVSFPRGVSNVQKYIESDGSCKKGTPMHVRASIMYNKHLKLNGLDKKYELITDGSKMKYTYMKMPNPIGENVFGYVNVFPKELNLHQYIDYNKQFEKSYLEPVKSILDCIGWTTEKTNTLF